MLKLFLTFFKIGAFTFGGGYAMVPLIQDELVKKQKLVSEEEFLDYLSIAQSYPGAVSYTHLTLPTTVALCRSRWSPYH